VSREVKGNIKVDNGEAVCGDRRWMEVSQEDVKYRVFISGVEPSVSPTWIILLSQHGSTAGVCYVC
jgi:hypothetical protein